jgi:hypothetical protein
VNNPDTSSDSNEIAALADLLHETEDHHGVFEKTAPKHNWWDWYAAYMHARQHNRTADEAAQDAGRYVEQKLGGPVGQG